MRSPPTATPFAWARAVVGLALGALPGIALFIASRSVELGVVAMAAIALYFLSFPVAMWQVRRSARLGLARGFMVGVILTTAAVPATLCAALLLRP
ncbi:MAG TPA: hypothetical protein VGR57_19310 [Ktedonobacterales bacterium]|nr:hypothetical protein [Ktedonobacterales bacterium]